jgi:hypothetical protein
MKQLANVLGFPCPDNHTCEACILGKAHITRLPKLGQRAQSLLELVHTDLFVAALASLGGSKYLAMFTDDYTNFVTGFLQRDKSALTTLHNFKVFHKRMTNLTGLSLKTIRADLGTEYKNSDFQTYCEQHGISRQFSAPGAQSHGQNGVAERMNRTIAERALSMLVHASLPLTYWGEAMLAAIYVHNMLPDSTRLSPFERVTGNIPDMSRIKVWGCVAFAIRHRDDRESKLHPKAIKGRFVGYDVETKAYRIRVGTKTVLAHDVMFWEDVFDLGAKDVVKYDRLTPAQQDAFRRGLAASVTPESVTSDAVESGSTGKLIQILTPIPTPGTAVPVHHLISTPIIPPAVMHPTISPTSSVISSISSIPGTPDPFEATADSFSVDSEDESVTGVPYSTAASPPSSPEMHSPTIGLRRSSRPNIGIPPPDWRNNIVGMLRDVTALDDSLTAARNFLTSAGEFANMVVEDVCASAGEGLVGMYPRSMREVAASPERAQWEAADKSELDSITENDVYELVPRPPGIPVLPAWIIRVKKFDQWGNLSRFKSRLVGGGHRSILGIHYMDTFAPTAKMVSIRLLVALAAIRGWKMHQMDITTAFLYAPIDRDVYVEQPDGYAVGDPKGMVWKLKRALYGLKQSPHLWNKTLDEFMKSKGLNPTMADPCVYVKWKDGVMLAVAVYVDDLMIMSSSQEMIDELKKDLNGRFKMKDIGELKYCLGIQVTRETNGIRLHQTGYINELLKRFNMEDCKPVNYPMGNFLLGPPTTPMPELLYRELVGCLQYLSVATRPDITFAVSQLSKHLNSYDETHMTAAKRVLRYLKKTKDMGILFSGDVGELSSYAHSNYNGPPPEQVFNRQVISFTDADFGGNVFDRRSVTGYVNMFAGGAVSWKSQTQPTTALSTLESEYMAMSKGAQEVIWIRLLLKELKVDQGEKATVLYGDNMGCIATALTQKTSQQVKHIDIRHHFIRETVAAKTIEVKHCGTLMMLADVFTKAFMGERFVELRTRLGVR